tara:strand:- start:42 stop:386 length:345 start_codon:yes stop_codon:yes gene_type:complete
MSCSEDEFNTTMTISNNKVDESITRVKLVGYDFSSLNIRYGESKKFKFNEGINGGYTNVNVDFETNCIGAKGGVSGGAFGISYNVVFLEGGNTTITLNDCPDAKCDCVQFSFSG